jgi:ferritin-like metal-binding protein YciE
MNIEETTRLGMNRTGRKMAPIESKKTAEGAAQLTLPPSSGEDNISIAENRSRYIMEAEPVGTVPLPGTLRGMLSALMEKINNGDHTFLDKLGERIAFERTGVRLYDALIAKHKSADDHQLYPDLETLERFQREEKEHFLMLSEVMEQIGGDATAMTPSADMAGVAAMGWVQVLSDPRSDFKQCLEIILQAELVDNNCWDVLIELAEDVGLTQLATRFQSAKNQEEVHLETIRKWVLELNLNGSADSPPATQAH